VNVRFWHICDMPDGLREIQPDDPVVTAQAQALANDIFHLFFGNSTQRLNDQK